MSVSLYSHPDMLLSEHLMSVMKIALKNYDEYRISKPKLLDEEALREVIKFSALFHDIAKATPYFQKKLKNPAELNAEEKDLSEHSLLSAVVCYLLLEKVLKNSGCKDEKDTVFYTVLAFLIVKNHHSYLSDILDDLSSIDDEKVETFKKQLSAVDEKDFSDLLKVLNQSIGFQLKLEDIKKSIEEIESKIRKAKRIIRKIIKTQAEKEDMSIYFKINFLFSLLIDADKSNAAGIDHKRSVVDITEDIIIKYKTKKGFKENPINQMRNQAFNEIISCDIPEDKRIFSINLPTGLGKTLSALALAFKLRNRIANKTSVCPRIIYSLPYLSIIDQNAAVLEEVLTTSGIETTTDVLLKHHYLAPEIYKGTKEELTEDEAAILIENWSSEIIITTFVQLLQETLISSRNKGLKKFHKLSNSVIIMDEPQVIPYKYWHLIEKVFVEGLELLNSYLIVLTATEPKMFEKKDVFYLVEPKKYFKSLDRVVIKPRLDKKMTLEEFINETVVDKNKRYLFIFNTIGSAKKGYDLLKERLIRKGIYCEDSVGEEVLFLSTHVVPKQRRERIKKLQDKKVRFCVTTQLVEAGVDINFDIVYRDIAPLDSINQAAGRCNRHGNKEKGVLYVVELTDEEGRGFYRNIYSKIQIESTKEILSKHRNIEETVFLTIINEYYEELDKRKSNDESKEILEAIYKLKYDGEEGYSISSFRLIEESNSINVFIELDEKAREIWQKFLNLKKIKNVFERRKEFKKIKTEFYDYVISLRYPDKADLPPLVEGFGYVNYEQLEDYYDKSTGYNTADVLIF